MDLKNTVLVTVYIRTAVMNRSIQMDIRPFGENSLPLLLLRTAESCIRKAMFLPVITDMAKVTRAIEARKTPVESISMKRTKHDSAKRAAPTANPAFPLTMVRHLAHGEKLFVFSPSCAGEMRAALVVFKLSPNRGENVAKILHAVEECGRVDLIVFPEAALTGLVNRDVPEEDLRLGVEITSPEICELRHAASEKRTNIALGFLERDGNTLYDAAVLIDRCGKIALHYRRITPGWHGPDADPEVYREGETLPVADTDLGRVAFLICGDLFEDALVHRVRDRGVDLLLYPFSRCFASGLWDEEAWRAERAHYVRRAVRTGATVLMVNTLGCRELDGGTFGGALAVSRTGEILAELPPGKEGILIADL